MNSHSSRRRRVGNFCHPQILRFLMARDPLCLTGSEGTGLSAHRKWYLLSLPGCVSALVFATVLARVRHIFAKFLVLGPPSVLPSGTGPVAKAGNFAIILPRRGFFWVRPWTHGTVIFAGPLWIKGLLA